MLEANAVLLILLQNTKEAVGIVAGVISSLQEQASKAEHVPTVYVDWAACLPKDTEKLPNQPIEVRYHAPEEEIALGDSRTHTDVLLSFNPVRQLLVMVSQAWFVHPCVHAFKKGNE